MHGAARFAEVEPRVRLVLEQQPSQPEAAERRVAPPPLLRVVHR